MFTDTRIVDIIESTGMHQEPLGVTITSTRCQKNLTNAYNIGKSALLSVNTAELFPAGVAIDFSILITARPVLGN